MTASAPGRDRHQTGIGNTRLYNGHLDGKAVHSRGRKQVACGKGRLVVGINGPSIALAFAIRAKAQLKLIHFLAADLLKFLF